MSGNATAALPPPSVLAELNQLDRFFLIGGGLVLILFGIQLPLWAAVMEILWKGRKGKTSPMVSYGMMGFVTVLCGLQAVWAITTAVGLVDTYINTGIACTGGSEIFTTNSGTSYNVAALAAWIVGSILQDGLLLWRARMIFAAVGGPVSQLWLIFPAIIFLGSIGVSIPFQIFSANAGLYGSLTTKYATAYFAASTAVNIILTACIATRILLYQREGRGLLGTDFGKAYTTVYTIFIDSAALYAIVAIATFVTFAIDSPYNQIWSSLAPGTQVVASYLIIYRASNNRSWDSQQLTRTYNKPSTLHFNTSGTAVQRSNTDTAGSFSPRMRGAEKSFGSRSGEYVDNIEVAVFSETTSSDKF